MMSSVKEKLKQSTLLTKQPITLVVKIFKSKVADYGDGTMSWYSANRFSEASDLAKD